MASTELYGRPWIPAFLRALAKDYNVKAAAKAAGIAAPTAYQRRRIDARLSEAWQECDRKGKARKNGTAKAGGSLGRRAGGWRAHFLELLAETSCVSAAAKGANVPLSTAYKERRKDSKFAAEWRAALAEGYEHLEMEVLAYLRGTASERKLDVPNAIRLLAAHRKTVMEFRASQEPDDEQEVLASIDDMLDRMRREAATHVKGETDDEQG